MSQQQNQIEMLEMYQNDSQELKKILMVLHNETKRHFEKLSAKLAELA